MLLLANCIPHFCSILNTAIHFYPIFYLRAS
uniref:Uncharacterized protein n=2 Tax=unclassified Caudoviricetes TaxID=2788787 RepID=A0A8S5PI49_9CAUD|nr:MAG TPA: hypothetical protein [Siphoviridae sp. ctJcm18]DAE06586.1 MAG TPA: hypothetical protein [Siphoviridae sp. ctUGQ45]